MASLLQTDAAQALTDALTSNAPASEHAEALMLYGQFLGTWDFEWTGYDEEGAETLSERGEWIFSWVLEGRGVQDVWITPDRSRRGRKGVPPGEYGTTIRFYDPASDDWKVTWNGPLQGARRTFIARKVGDEIVQEGETGDGHPLRWIFSDITPDSFLWQSRYSRDGGKSWIPREEMRVRRR